MRVFEIGDKVTDATNSDRFWVRSHNDVWVYTRKNVSQATTVTDNDVAIALENDAERVSQGGEPYWVFTPIRNPYFSLERIRELWI